MRYVFWLGVFAVLTGCSAEDKIGSQPSALSTDEIQTYLNSKFYADSDIRHSFNTAVGERIDCIDFYAQPTVKAMLAAGLAVPTAVPPAPPLPTGIPKPHKPPAVSVKFDGSPDQDGNARQCPPGTVPAMRPTRAEIQGAGGLNAYLSRKRPPPTVDPNQDPLQHDCYHQLSPGQGYDHAAGVQYPPLTYYGAYSTVSVYEPEVHDLVGEHSLSQLWVQTGNCEDWGFPYGDPDTCTTGPSGDAVQSVEVGWMVGNGYTDDPAAPHLFAFITQDGYHAQNCFAGQANPDGHGGTTNCCSFGDNPTGTDCWIAASGAPLVINQSLGPWVQPVPSSSPAEMAIQIWNGTAYGYPAWWVYIDGQLIGWYPNSAFSGQMQSSATYMQAGGEVFDSWPSGAHTSTLMGSGIYPSVPPPGQNYGYVSYHRNVSYIDIANHYHDASLAFVITPSGELDHGYPGICGYDAGDFGYGLSLEGGQSGWGSYFFFGGNEIF